jgi:hypothetical protein
MSLRGKCHALQILEVFNGRGLSKYSDEKPSQKRANFPKRREETPTLNAKDDTHAPVSPRVLNRRSLLDSFVRRGDGVIRDSAEFSLRTGGEGEQVVRWMRSETHGQVYLGG